MKIMVSACLLNDNVKYDGGNNYCPLLAEYLRGHEIIKVCPEVMGGLGIPRVPAEIFEDMVINKEGIDVTKEYLLGAEKTLKLALENNVKVAILKKNSPSCGSGKIYDGTFRHKLISGDGITTRLLKEHGVMVLNEDNYKDYI